MKDFLANSLYFGVTLSILAYWIGLKISRRFKNPLANPLLIAVVLVVVFLKITGVDYDSYYESAQYLSYLITPATICLAIPLYKQLDVLKENLAAVTLGITAGVLTGFISVFGLSLLFKLSYKEFITILPKSLTSAIGISLAEELGGIPVLTLVSILITGLFGNIAAPGLCRLLRITVPEARGLAIGCSSHAFGTARAIEMGEAEGATSSLAIVVTGLFAVVTAPLFAALY